MNRIVEFALRQRLLIVGIFVAMLVAGGVGFYNLNIEAYPDPVPPMVEIITQTQGLSAEEMERNVTIPIEVGMAGIPHLTAIRAISLFGLSDIKIQFSYDFTNDQAKQQVINRLSQLPRSRVVHSRRCPRPARSARSSATRSPRPRAIR